MFCSSCGAQNSGSSRFCEKCGGALGAASSPSPDANAQGGQAESFAGTGGGSAAFAGSGFADPRMRGVATQSSYPGSQPGKVYANGKTPIVALLLSFVIPGVGQFYNADNKKGAIMLGVFLVSCALSAIGIGIIGIVGVWLWSMFDAYNVASGKSPLM